MIVNKPILKWAGRKDYLLENIDTHITLLKKKNLLKENFNYHETFEFVHYSNCKFFHVKQKEVVFRFERKD